MRVLLAAAECSGTSWPDAVMWGAVAFAAAIGYAAYRFTGGDGQ